MHIANRQHEKGAKAVSGRRLGAGTKALELRELPVVKQENGATDDHQGKGDERPAVEVQAEDRVAVRASPRNDVEQNLAHRQRGADGGA